jgi:hypothetical protein
MTTTYYVSITSDGDSISRDPDNAGTSSTAADVFELRMGNGTTVPTQRQVLNVLECFERWIIQNGLDGAGANLPPNRG